MSSVVAGLLGADQPDRQVVTQALPQQTPEERGLQEQQVELAQRFMESLGGQTEFQQLLFGAGAPFFQQETEFQNALAGIFPPKEQAALFAEDFGRQRQLGGLSDELFQLELENIRQGTSATDQERALINAATEAAITSGTSDINEARRLGLEALREELAPSLGLRPGDTPILDRGARLAAESARQTGQLVTDLRGQQAEQELLFPLERGRFESQQIGQAQGDILGFRNLLANIQAEAANNRLRLAQGATGGGLGLLGAQTQGQFGLSSAISGFQAPRLAGRTTRTETIDPVGQFGRGVDIFGTLLGQAGAASAGAGQSSKDVKTNKRPIDDALMLEKIEDLDIERWNYRDDPEAREHIGPYAEDFREKFEVGDPSGKTIHLLDASGVALAGVKALSKKIDRLTDALGLEAEIHAS